MWLISIFIQNSKIDVKKEKKMPVCFIGKITIKCNTIRPFPMLDTTGSFSPYSGLPVKFCVDFNHFKSIVMSTLLHRKTLKG